MGSVGTGGLKLPPRQNPVASSSVQGHQRPLRNGHLLPPAQDRGRASAPCPLPQSRSAGRASSSSRIRQEWRDELPRSRRAPCPVHTIPCARPSHGNASCWPLCLCPRPVTCDQDGPLERDQVCSRPCAATAPARLRPPRGHVPPPRHAQGSATGLLTAHGASARTAPSAQDTLTMPVAPRPHFLRHDLLVGPPCPATPSLLRSALLGYHLPGRRTALGLRGPLPSPGPPRAGRSAPAGGALNARPSSTPLLGVPEPRRGPHGHTPLVNRLLLGHFSVSGNLTLKCLIILFFSMYSKPSKWA